MSVQYEKIEGNSEVRIQVCKKSTHISFSSPLIKGILHTELNILLEYEDLQKVTKMLNNALGEIAERIAAEEE